MSKTSEKINGENGNGQILCPRSWANADLLSENYKLHFTSPDELKLNGGVCSKCAAQIRKGNAGMLAGRETQGDFHNGHHQEVAPDVHAGWEGEHELVPSVEFNYDSVEEALGIIRAVPRDARAQAAEVLRQLMAWCFKGDPPLRSALVKFTMIVAGLRPEILGNRTMKELAIEIGITKQGMSKQSVNFQDAFGIQFSRSRSKEGRDHMADARRGGPPRNFGTHPISGIGHPIKESPVPEPPLVSDGTAKVCRE
jgi:hypothetical protein